MAENTGLLIVGMLIVVLLTAGLTYYITKGTVTQPLPPVDNKTGETPTITVRGEATKTFTPDLLTIGISLESFGNDTASSQAQSSKDTAAFKAALLATGLNNSEIQTSSYYTYPVYNDSCFDCYPYRGGVYPTESGGMATGYATDAIAVPVMPPCNYESNCTIIGYSTVHSIMVKTSRTSDGGKFVEAAVNATNATKIDYVYFSIKDETRVKVESELEADAAASTKAKAENIASGIGASLGKIVSINPDYYYPYPMYAYQKGDTTSGGVPATPPTEIFPTDTTMSASIVVVYELEQ